MPTQPKTAIHQDYVIESNNFFDLIHNLSQFSIIFPISQEKVDSTIPFLQLLLNAGGNLSIQLFRFNQQSNFIALNAINENLLSDLKNMTSVIFFNRQLLIGNHYIQGNLLWKQLESLGYKIFLNYSFFWDNTYPKNYSLIDIFEFSVSSYERLTHFPKISVGYPLNLTEVEIEKRPCCLFMLDLIQDFEILIPIIQTLAFQIRNIKIKVLYTKRFSSFPATSTYLSALKALNITHYQVSEPYEVIPFTEKNDIFITASESSASAHSFNHSTCKILEPSVLKITIQHGFENIGLNHHRAHNLQFPNSVRFASDFIFTWAHPEAYKNIHPAEFNKCIPVGIIKSLANESCQYRNYFLKHSPGYFSNFILTQENPFKLLLGENLHSVRFQDQGPVYKYLQFIDYLYSSPLIELTVRCHPSKRWLEVNNIFEGIRFYNDVLSISRLSYFQGIISPPSTFILDAILCNIPVCIWTIDSFGIDTVNYPSLLLVHNVNSFLEFVSRCSNSLSDTLYNQLSFLAQNTVSFNGTPYLISSVLSLL